MTDTTPTPADRPADLLRAAADQLREEAARAHRASPSPWAVTDEHVVRCADGMIVADRSGSDHPAERADLPYIALMHPGVGLALATWLERAADASDHHGPGEGGVVATLVHPALAVARQLLGTSAAEGDRRCVCGDPIEWMTHPDGSGWIHSPGSDTRCLDARPTAAPPAPADRAAVLREGADELGRMDYDVDANDYGYDSYRDAWNSGVMDGAGLLRRLAADAAAGVQPPTTDRAAERLDLVRAAVRLHRLELITTAELYAVIEAQPATPPAAPASPEETQ